jgi:hypothetical protein
MLLDFEAASVEGDLDVVALTASSWRVSDKRFSPDDARGLLAYMERVDDHIAVTLLKPPPVRFANASTRVAYPPSWARGMRLESCSLISRWAREIGLPSAL